MIDTTALTAAVETLQLYCEQVRLVMIARGYAKARVFITPEAGGDSWRRGCAIAVYDARDEHGKFFDLTDFAGALAYAESSPIRVTPDDFAATIGIAPDGRLLEQVEG